MTAAIAWERSPDRLVWVAQVPGTRTVLTVTRLGLDRWQPAVLDGSRGPLCRTRLAAQVAAEKLPRISPAGGQS